MKTAIMIVAGWTLLNLVVFAVALLRRDPEIRAKALDWVLSGGERQRRRARATPLRSSRSLPSSGPKEAFRGG
jgi:hypothetical protein